METQSCTLTSSLTQSNMTAPLYWVTWKFQIPVSLVLRLKRKLLSGCNGQWWIYDSLENHTLFWRTDFVIHTASQQKCSIAGTDKEWGIQLLMQNNAVYTLLTLLWLALTLKRSFSSSRSCLLHEVKIYFPLKERLLFTVDVPKFWGEYPKVGREGESRAGLTGLSGVRAEQWDRGTPGWLRVVPFPAHCSHQQTPGWAKVGQALPEPRSAPEGEVWLEYRVINKPVLISTSVDTVKEEADWWQTALATVSWVNHCITLA